MPVRQFHSLPFSSVQLNDAFWSAWQKVNRTTTLKIEYEQCRDTGRIDALKMQWKPGMNPVPHIFWDSDVAKWIEAASYSLSTHADAQLDALLDETIDLITAAQEADGYFNSHFSQVAPEKRWTNLRDWHELYCAGHLMEAAVAHFQATGKRSLLDVMCRYADYIGKVFGRGEGQLRGYPGHEEIELALVKLYRVTQQERYLQLAKYFIDERGAQPHYYDAEAVARGEDPAAFWAKNYAYMQAQVPVREQTVVEGHAVRAMYLYSAMADLAAETNDESLWAACRTLWADLTEHKLYITGGLGPSRHNEGFTNDYDLPNESAYAETCAAVGLVFWAQRMLEIDCDSRYADVMETALYNGTISGMSLDGRQFFYENPLASSGKHHRKPWFDCACCPPNIARLIASVGGYAYGYNENEAAVHLYIAGEAKLPLKSGLLTLKVETQYPWDGLVNMRVDISQPAEFALRLRIPAWWQGRGAEAVPPVRILGEKTRITMSLEHGYLVIHRLWQPGDEIEISFEMPVRRVYARPEVQANQGLVALQRGPVVYCLESVDQQAPLQLISLPRDVEVQTEFQSDLLGGVMTLKAQALAAQTSDWGRSLYRTRPTQFSATSITAIPYYAWDNRAAGEMRVWLPEK